MVDFPGIKKKADVFFKDRHNVIALAIFLFALVLRMNYAFISGLWVDEGRYAVIGLALLDHPLDYSSRMHGVVTQFPPVLPYMLFISQAIFGAGDFAVRIVNPILGSLSILIIYALGRMMFNKNAGLIAAALMSVSPIAWFYDERILLETPMNFFGLLTVFCFYYGYTKKNDEVLYASGAAFVLGFLSKQSTGIVLSGILLYLFLAKRMAWIKEKRIWAAALVALLVMAPWAIRSLAVCGSISCEGSFARQWLEDTKGGGIDVLDDPFYYAKLTPYLLTTPVLVLFFFGLIPLVNGKSRKEYALLLCISLVTYIVFALTPVKDLRYVLLAVPPILLVAAYGIDEVARQLAGKQAKYIALLVIAILIPVSYGAYSSGKALILDKAPGFLMLKDTGLYFSKMPSDIVIMAAPPQPISFYGGDKKTAAYPVKQEDLEGQIYNTGTDYVVVDAYERTQYPWILQYVPNRPYLSLEKMFYQNNQPVVAIFKVDQGKLLNELANKTGV